MKIEWDARKSRANYRKHDVRFEEARTAFSDDEAIVFDDPDHSDSEDRFILLGMSSLARVLVVVHCLRDKGDTIRVISARKATKAEREAYARGVR
jgi:uncharacterized DUF497 family protein